MTTKEGIDLVAAAFAMPPAHAKLGKMILQVRDAHSAHTDLTSAFDMINALPYANEVADAGANWANHAVSALLTSAIVLYARATKTRSRHRSPLSLEPYFSEEERGEHEWICKLRDDTLAHYGPGEMFNGSAWHEEKVILPLDRPEDARIMMASRRVAASTDVTNRVKMQIHRSMLLAQMVIQRREVRLIEQLELAMDNDPDFPSLLKKHRIDMSTAFEEHPIAELILDGPRQGSATRIVWAPIAETP